MLQLKEPGSSLELLAPPSLNVAFVSKVTSIATVFLAGQRGKIDPNQMRDTPPEDVSAKLLRKIVSVHWGY